MARARDVIVTELSTGVWDIVIHPFNCVVMRVLEVVESSAIGLIVAGQRNFPLVRGSIILGWNGAETGRNVYYFNLFLLDICFLSIIFVLQFMFTILKVLSHQPQRVPI